MSGAPPGHPEEPGGLPPLPQRLPGAVVGGGGHLGEAQQPALPVLLPGQLRGVVVEGEVVQAALQGLNLPGRAMQLLM